MTCIRQHCPDHLLFENWVNQQDLFSTQTKNCSLVSSRKAAFLFDVRKRTAVFLCSRERYVSLDSYHRTTRFWDACLLIEDTDFFLWGVCNSGWDSLETLVVSEIAVSVRRTVSGTKGDPRAVSLTVNTSRIWLKITTR